MSWQEIEVLGAPDRQAINRAIASKIATVEIELAGDALPPHSWEIADMWFVTLRLTGSLASDDYQPTPASERRDSRVVTHYVGVIADTDVMVRLTYVSNAINRFEVDLNPDDGGSDEQGNSNTPAGG